jgi:hypothetical protein
MSLQRKLQRVDPPAPAVNSGNAPTQPQPATTIAEEVNVDIVSPDRRLLFEGALFSVNKKDPDFYIFLFNGKSELPFLLSHSLFAYFLSSSSSSLSLSSRV